MLLGGSQAPPSFWRKFLGDFSGTVDFKSNPEVPRSQTTPETPRTSPEFPASPQSSAFSLESLTPSDDS